MWLRSRSTPEGPLAAGVAALSTMVFHSLHSGQRPIHLGLSAPHCWQRKLTLGPALAIVAPEKVGWSYSTAQGRLLQ